MLNNVSICNYKESAQEQTIFLNSATSVQKQKSSREVQNITLPKYFESVDILKGIDAHPSFSFKRL